MLTTNLIRKDLTSSGLYEAGLALNGLACFVSNDLARDLANDVVTLVSFVNRHENIWSGLQLSSSRPYVRKKAVLLLYKIFLKYPDALRPTFARLKEKLEDPDPGVQSAAVNVICELVRCICARTDSIRVAGTQEPEELSVAGAYVLQVNDSVDEQLDADQDH